MDSFYETMLEERPITFLGYSARIINSLRSIGIFTVGELIAREPKQLMKARRFGPICLKRVKGGLAVHSLYLKNTQPATPSLILNSLVNQVNQQAKKEGFRVEFAFYL